MILTTAYNGVAALYHGRRGSLRIHSTLPTYRQKTIAGDKGKFVFSTPFYQHTLMYAGSTRKAFRGFDFLSTSDGKERSAVLYIVPDGKEEMDILEADYKGSKVFEVDQRSFYPVVHEEDGMYIPSKELVSREPVPIKRTVEVFPTLRDLMEEGLQVFTIEYSKVKPQKKLSEIQMIAATRGFEISRDGDLLYSQAVVAAWKGKQRVFLDREKDKYLEQMIKDPSGILSLVLSGEVRYLNPFVVGRQSQQKIYVPS